MTGELPKDFEMESDGDVKLAPERFSSTGEIIDVCNAMLSADRVRAPWRASIDGLVDGNDTYKLSTLRAKGQSWRARVNYRESEGLISSRQTPIFDLVTEVDPCVAISLDYGKGVDQQDWADAMARHFHCMLMKRWRSSFNFHVPLQQLELLKHGIGYHVWPGPKNIWTPRTPTTGHVLFPDGVSLNLEEDLEYFMLRDFMPGFAIFKHIRNEKAASTLGWKVPTVWQALLQTSKVRPRNASNDNVEAFQREMRAGDIGTSQSRQAGLWLNHLFVKEIGTGKISQYTVAEGVTVNAPRGSRKDDPFQSCLFRKRNRFDSWPLVIFPIDIGSGGDLHTVRGLGARTKAFFELSNRLKNAMADQVLVGSTINLKQTGNVDPDKLKLMRLGMMSIIPQGLEAMVGVQFPPLAQGPIALLQELKSTLQSNNESYLQGFPEPKDRETAQSMTMRMQNSGQVSKGFHSLYSSNYQQFLEHMVRTAFRSDAVQGDSYSAQLAKEMQDRCIKDGVPKEAFSKIYEVDEILSTGAGSAAARIDALMTIMKVIYPTTTEPRKINIERDIVSALMTSSKVDRYARSLEDNQSPDSDMSFAVQENNGMAQGGEAEAASEQDHVEHLQKHLAKAAEIVQMIYSGQMDPAQGLSIIQMFGKHCAQHLQFLQQNPMRKAELDALTKEWTALSVIADKLQQQVEEAAAAEQQPSPEQQVSDDLKIGLAKVGAQEKVGMAKVATQGRINLSKLAIDSRLQAAKTASEIRQNRNGSRPVAARA